MKYNQNYMVILEYVQTRVSYGCYFYALDEIPTSMVSEGLLWVTKKGEYRTYCAKITDKGKKYYKKWEGFYEL